MVTVVGLWLNMNLKMSQHSKFIDAKYYPNISISHLSYLTILNKCMSSFEV